MWPQFNNLSVLSIVAAGVRRMSAMDKIEEISFYFNLGMNYNDMLKSLAVRQGVIISKRHLIRLLKMHGYSRRQYDDLGDVIEDGPRFDSYTSTKCRADLRSHRTHLGLHKVASNDRWITAGVCRFKPNYFTGKAVYATIDADPIWFSFII